MHQHRAGIDKLFNLEMLQRAQQMPRAFNVHALVKRILLIAEVVVSNQVQHAGNAIAEARLESVQRKLNRRCRGKVGFKHCQGRRFEWYAIDSGDPKILPERARQRLAEPACRARDEDNRS